MIHTDQKLLDSLKGPGPCESCLRQCRQRSPHHAASFRGQGGGFRLDVPFNLLQVCDGPRGCHTKFQNFVAGYEKERALRILAVRENCEPGDITDAIYIIRRLRKDDGDEKVEHELGEANANVRSFVWDVVERVRKAA